MLHVLPVLQIQQNWLWTWLEGKEEESKEEEEEEASTDDRDEEEEEETEEEDEDDVAQGNKQARGAPKREHSEDQPKYPVVPEKHSSRMLEVKEEPQTMAEKKKQISKEQGPPKVPPKKSEAEMPNKTKDKDKPARGHVSSAIGGKGLQRSISAATSRAERFQHEGGYDRDLHKRQRILETDFNATVGRLRFEL